jgi:hypothetical protein
VNLNHDSTVLQLKELIEKSVGIPAHDQRLMTMDASRELSKKSEEVREALDGRSPEVAVMVRQYQRREMQAAWLIEGIWKRRRAAFVLRTHEAAARIGTFWRTRQANKAAAQENAAMRIAAFYRYGRRSQQKQIGGAASSQKPTSVYPVASVLSTVDEGEAILNQVMQESAVEAVLREQEHLSRAMLLSKQDRYRNEDVSIFRLTKHSPKVFEVVQASPELSSCHARVHEAGCQVRPPWCRGLLLLPLTEEQYNELDLHLEPHHVLARACDREQLESALRRVPCRLRPQVRTDHRSITCDRLDVAGSPHGCFGADVVVAEAGVADMRADAGPCLQIVRTFLHSPVTPLATEVSSSKMAHSAPP